VPYPSLIAGPDELRAWMIPAKLLREGKKSLEAMQTSGEPTSVVFVDLTSGQKP